MGLDVRSDQVDIQLLGFCEVMYTQDATLTVQVSEDV